VKSILAAPVFTPGAAMAGTLVFSGFKGFNTARLMAVSNVTRRTLIYAVEEPGKAGAWSAVTASGGTLTLDADTATHASDDVLRCIYESDESTAEVGGNLWPKPLDTCYLYSSHSRTPDYGPGPFPGTRSTRFVFSAQSGSDVGATTEDIPLIGRTDGALFGIRLWIKGSGNIEVRIRGTGTTSALPLTETIGYVAPTTEWACHIVRTTLSQFDCATVRAEIRASASAGATVEISLVDFRLLGDSGEFPEYQAPTGVVQTTYVHRRLTCSVAAWTDSMWQPVSGYPVPIYQILKGAKVYSGNVGGETSTQVKDRFIADTTAAKLYRAFGVETFWVGHNNHTATATILSDLDTMIALVNHGRVLVLPMLPKSDEGPGTAAYAYYQAAYKAFKQRYGKRFCDITIPLYGDTGFTLPQYRIDTRHLNAAGLEIVANCIAKSIAENGWLDAGAWNFGVNATGNEVAQITTVGASLTTVAVLARGARKGFRICNEATTGTMLLAFGDAASATSYSKRIAAGADYELLDGYSGPLSALWTVADGNARVTEII
jgi:hypothetical protein